MKRTPEIEEMYEAETNHQGKHGHSRFVKGAIWAKGRYAHGAVLSPMQCKILLSWAKVNMEADISEAGDEQHPEPYFWGLTREEVTIQWQAIINQLKKGLKK